MSALPITFERRLDLQRRQRIALPFAALLLAALLTSALLLMTGHDPLATYGRIFVKAFLDPDAITATLTYATPLLFTGLCVAVAFRVKVWNIGGEGQLYMGAAGAAAVGLLLQGWPAAIVVPAMAIGGAVSGMLWGLVPGILKAYLRTNEILVSLMLNYVAGLLTYFLIYDSRSFIRDLTSPSALVFPQGKTLGPDATWPAIGLPSFSLPFGFLLGAVLSVGLLVILRWTRFGFEMRVMGDSSPAASYAGISTRRTIVLVMALSGAMAGLAGASQIGDFGHVFDPKGLQAAAYGYTGIVVAALAFYEPVGVVLVSVLIGALTSAGFALQGPSFPAGLVGTMEGIILFSVLGAELLGRYRVRLRVREHVASEGAASSPKDVEEARP